MTKKNTKKALVLSVLSLVVCFSMLVGTTFAWFTDSVSSANNVIASGNLDVTLEYWADANNDGTKEWVDVQGADDIFNPAAKWEPGYADVVYFRISNVGSLAMQYSFVMNVNEPAQSTNVNGDKFYLSDYIQYSIVEGATENQFGTDRAAAIAAATADGQVPRALSNDTADRVTSNGTALESGDFVKFAVVVWMPETVGNEANYRGEAPQIDLTFNVIATQATSENDGFGTNDYDEGADLGAFATGISKVEAGATAVEVVAIDAAGYNKGSATVPAEALAKGVTQVKMNVEEVDTYAGNFNIPAHAKTFDIKVEGIKDGNTVPVMAQIKIAADLDPNTVKLYHYDTEIACTYNHQTGYVTFETATFSPFTVLFDANSKYEAPEVPEDGEGNAIYPTATVTYESQYVNNTEIEWGNYGQWSPTAGLDSNLEAAFTFACPTNLDPKVEAAFESWHCDFYVSLDRDLGENQIFLGGNYGDFGWIGFHNGDITLAADEELGLLEGVTTNPWTYANVRDFVGTFTCGVGDVKNALEGATFTVKLRLTNPENSSEYYDIETINYTFTTVVNTAEDIQNAVDNGDEHITLGGDIDLNDLFNN